MEPKPEIPWHAWQLQGCRLQLRCSPHPTKLHCAVITFAPSPCSLLPAPLGCINLPLSLGTPSSPLEQEKEMKKEPAFVACCITHSFLSPPTPPSCVLALTIPRPLELRNGNRLPLAWLPIYNSHYPPQCHTCSCSSIMPHMPRTCSTRLAMIFFIFIYFVPFPFLLFLGTSAEGGAEEQVQHVTSV